MTGADAKGKPKSNALRKYIAEVNRGKRTPTPRKTKPKPSYVEGENAPF